ATAPLGNREAEVAQLVAEGLSNKDIGARLFISERTVDSHIRSILNKLGFNSRAQVALWVGSGQC
ncbi:MAG: helix-turn-helix transcriptional regulator, partial [Chloroflexi bacterium]